MFLLSTGEFVFIFFLGSSSYREFVRVVRVFRERLD